MATQKMTKNAVRELDKAGIAALTQEDVSALAKSAYSCYATACKRFKLEALPHVVEVTETTEEVAEVAETPVQPVEEVAAKEETVSAVETPKAEKNETPKAKAPVAPKAKDKQPRKRKFAYGPLVEARDVWDELPEFMQNWVKAVEADVEEIGYELSHECEHNGEAVTLTPTMVYRVNAQDPKSYRFAMVARFGKKHTIELRDGKHAIRDENGIKVLVPNVVCPSAVEYHITIGILTKEIRNRKSDVGYKAARKMAQNQWKARERCFAPVAKLIEVGRRVRGKLNVKHNPGTMQVALRNVS